jgi:hypothetical protein
MKMLVRKATVHSCRCPGNFDSYVHKRGGDVYMSASTNVFPTMLSSTKPLTNHLIPDALTIADELKRKVVETASNVLMAISVLETFSYYRRRVSGVAACA